MIISSNIKKYREEKNFTQEELENRMNISRQSISKWERGDSLPSIDNLISLSELLDLSLDELIMNKGDLPLPLNFGKFKSKKVFIWWMFVPCMMILLGILTLPDIGQTFFYLLGGILIGTFIQGVGMIDLSRMYNFFTVSKAGIEFFDAERYCPKIIREILALFDKRRTKFINYSEIEEMEIYFNNNGFQGYNTTVAYRPRQYFYNREWFELHIILKTGEKIRLNLDRAQFPDSDERRYFYAMFEYFDFRGILIKDPYHILNSMKNEYSIIEEAYKLK